MVLDVLLNEPSRGWDSKLKLKFYDLRFHQPHPIPRGIYCINTCPLLVSCPMFSYYGSKFLLSKHYPKPKHRFIIEPFAGAAWYSVLHRTHDVVLNEKYETLFRLWEWLIQEAKPEDILKHTDFYLGQDIRDLQLTDNHLALIGFCINQASAAPRNIVQQFSCHVPSKPGWASVAAYQLKRVARLLPEIRHWNVQFGDYTHLPDVEATWFIDPPYQNGGQHYVENIVDYSELAEWCLSRRGQVIVCENSGADWLPFVPFRTIDGQRRKKTIEVVYVSE